MVLMKYPEDVLYIFNLLLRPLNSNVRAYIQRIKTNYVIRKKKGLFFCKRWKMLPSSNESWMTHLLLGKSEVASDLIAFSAVNTSKKWSLRDNKGSCEIQIILFLSQMTPPWKWLLMQNTSSLSYWQYLSAATEPTDFDWVQFGGRGPSYPLMGFAIILIQFNHFINESHRMTFLFSYVLSRHHSIFNSVSFSLQAL